MPNYCEFCGHCFEGDVFMCSLHERIMSESQIKRPNKCADYEYSEFGSCIDGREYKPRKRLPEEERQLIGQIKLEVKE